MSKSKFAVFMLAASISLATNCVVSGAAVAQLSNSSDAGTIGDTSSSSGGRVMIAQGNTSGSAPEGNSEATGILDEKGDLFMEEVPDNKPRKPITRVPIDLSRVGVSVDPHGQIVPLKDSPDDSWAGTGVKPFQNEISNTFQPLFQYGNLFGNPYGSPFGAPYGLPYPGGGYPGLPGYPTGFGLPYPGAGLPYPGAGLPYPGAGLPYPGAGLPYPGAGLPYPGAGLPYPGAGLPYPGAGFPYSGYGSPYGYGPGYPGYSGYPYYGSGYWSQPALSFRIGKFQAAIGSVPLPGINPYFSNPTMTYPGAAYPTFTGPAFTYPGNTTYTQSSMWRAFNLAF